MRSLRNGWALPLRLARRDAVRARGRSVLVLVLILLPVLAVTAAAVVARTTQVEGTESLDRRLGSAEALVTISPGSGRVLQGADPDADPSIDTGEGGESEAEVRRVLGDAPVAPLAESDVRVETDAGVADVVATELDLSDPLTSGLYDLTSGRWPGSADEVVVNQAVLDRGYALGDTLRLADPEAPAPRISGVAESTTLRTLPVVAGPAGSLGVDTAGTVRLLVGGGPVTWDQVRALNDAGALVLSRAVVLDPPSAAEVPEEVRAFAEGSDPTTLAVLALVGAMVLLEVVLLAGPAFAVGARRQARSLALLVSAGGTPAQARRTVLATAVVLGGAAAALGAVLGVVVAAAAMPLVQRFSDTWLGPFDVPWLVVVAVAVLGLVSALLAALVPAVLAARQDVVAVLAGRRGEPRPSRRSPVLGVALLGVGVACAAYGARASAPLPIAVSGVASVVGTVLLVPLVLAGCGRLAGRLPLVLRYAVRDAARQRTRTAPAVAAVAATVAGIVTLGIGATSQAAADEATYAEQLPLGSAMVTLGFSPDGGPLATDWDRVRSRVAAEAPDARQTDVRGVRWVDGTDAYTELLAPDGAAPLPTASSLFGTDLLVADATGPLLPGLGDADRAVADEALADGRAVVLTDRADVLDADTATLTVTRYDDAGGTEESTEQELPATYVAPPAGSVPTAVLPPSLAVSLGLPSPQVAVLLGGETLDADQEQTLTESVAALPGDLSLYVERGYVDRDSTTIVLLVLAALGAVLVLGGTLTATSLSLSDARPDLATLAAVGASPGTRRGVAAAYALVVAVVGGVLGAVVGFVPGLAIAVPLGTGSIGGVPAGPFVDVPWLLVLGLVVLLPLVSAALVAATTRSRLPMVARAA